ncbi:MAG: sodium:solute symporter family protein [Thermoguttaceae bacterium]
MLSPIDWGIIAVYIVICSVAGIRMRRYVKDVDDFAVASREVETSLGVASLAATEVGIVTVVYTAQMGFTNGPAGATPGILTAVAMLVVGLTGFVIVPLREARVMTIPELFENRFGTHVRWLAGVVVILGGLLNMGVFLRAGGDFLMHVTGISTLAGFEVVLFGQTMAFGYLELMMTGLLIVVLVYTILGGMLSVLITDFLQFLVMGLGIVIVSVMVVWYIPWPQFISGLSTAYESGQQYDRAAEAERQKTETAARQIEQSQGRQAADAFLAAEARRQGEALKASAGELAKQSILVDTKSDPAKPLTMAHPFDPFASKGLGLGWVLWQAMTAIAVVTTWQTTIARVLAARDADTAKRVYRGTWFYFVGRFCLPGLWGAGAFLYFSANGGLPPNTSSETAMAEFLRIILPTGLIGIVLAALLAAEMSTDSGYLLTWSTVIYNDLITPCLRRPLSSRARLLTIRLVVFAIGLFLVFWGLWYEMSGPVWEYLAVTGNIYLASLFALMIGALYWRGANSWGAVAAIVLGACGPLTFLVINAVVGRDSPYRIPGEVAGLAAFGLAFAGLIFGSLLATALGKGNPVGTSQEASS